MDDTAQNPQLQNQSPAQVTPVDNVPPAVPQQPVQPVSQPPVAGGRPEQGPIRSGLPTREAAPIDEADASPTATDDQAALPDEVSDASNVQQAETGDIKLQEAHPQVEISKELKEAGIEEGKDAQKDQIPGEQIVIKDDQAMQPDTQASASAISLATPPVQLEEVIKKSGIKDSIKWFAKKLTYLLKKMQMKPEEQKNTW